MTSFAHKSGRSECPVWTFTKYFGHSLAIFLLGATTKDSPQRTLPSNFPVGYIVTRQNWSSIFFSKIFIFFLVLIIAAIIGLSASTKKDTDSVVFRLYYRKYTSGLSFFTPHLLYVGFVNRLPLTRIKACHRAAYSPRHSSINLWLW